MQIFQTDNYYANLGDSKQLKLIGEYNSFLLSGF